MGFSEEDLKKLRQGRGVRAVHDPADKPRKDPPATHHPSGQAPATNRSSDQTSGQTRKKTVHARDRMNYTEKRYEDEFLWPKYWEGEILSWEFESLKFRLGEKCFYTPDFLVIEPDCLILTEIKGGFIREDAIAKFKSAVSMFPYFRWIFAQYKRKKWEIIVYGS